MAVHFNVTTRSLERNAPRSVTIALALGALGILGLWGAWACLASVGIYVSTTQARLEVTRMVHRVASPEDGRVAVLNQDLSLGRWVEPGEILLELDTEVERQRLQESEARGAVCAAKKEALQRQIEAEERVAELQTHVGVTTIKRAQAEVAQLQQDTAYQAGLRDISERLHEQQLASTVDVLAARRDTADVKGRAVSAAAEVRRLSATQRYDEGRTRASIAELQRTLVDLDAEAQLAGAAADTARAQVERRKIRAPVRGRLGNIATLQVGDVVKPTDIIATIVPADDVHAVAEFSPSDASGRVAPGQPARLRLSGFAWTRYGALDATVTSVASEPQDGVVRVELEVHASGPNSIPVQHGLPGSVEIEVGRTAPWRLALEMLAPAAPTVAVPTSPPVAKQ